MNTTNYKQYDTRWAKLPYRYNPDNIGNNGCGEVSVCNSIIEMVSQMNQTPATMVDYCRQYACSDGTYHSGIPKMLEHYGCTEVMEHPHFASLWRELEKGNRIAIYLMDSTPAGSKGVHWTSGGHFVASVAYKCENGQHWVYMKDSNSISELRNGWITYEGNIRGACPKVWSGKLNGSPAPTPPTPTPTPTGKIAVDGVGGYETVKRLQEFLKLSDPDGLIGRQRTSLKKYYPAFTAVSFSTSGGSNTITALQKWLGLSDPDGIMGKNTTSALQRRLRDYGYFDNPQESIDGIFGAKSMRALQTALNNDFKKKTDPPTPPTPTPTKGYKFIDVSEHQGKIDWAKVKADGVVGAIIRYAEDDYLDPRFAENMSGAKAAGLHIGAYIYSWAKTKAEAENYAVQLYNACKPYDCDMPLYIDLEKKGYEAYADDTAIAFLVKLDKLGCKKRGVYANLNWWNNYLKKTRKDYNSNAFWVAQYYDKCEFEPSSDVGMWQYTSQGKVDGIDADWVDMDICYIPYWERKEDPLQKWYDAMTEQYNWSKNQDYDWVTPTIESSKTKGTCITFPACSLQRLGMLPSGGYFYYYPDGQYLYCKPNGWLSDHSDWFSVSYPNKTIPELWRLGQIQKGDFVGFDNPAYHSMVFMGMNSSGQPIFNTMGHTKGLGITYSAYANRKVAVIVRLKKVK